MTSDLNSESWFVARVERIAVGGSYMTSKAVAAWYCSSTPESL